MIGHLPARAQTDRGNAAGKRERLSHAANKSPMVRPFARALALLATFTPNDHWLANGDLAARSELPPSTVTRLAKWLAQLGYLHRSPVDRKYRLSASVLALGYGAIANSAVQRSARAHMKTFADQHKVHVCLSTRDRLDLIILSSYGSRQSFFKLNLHVGARLGIASSPLGWALLAALPELERLYLMENIERRKPREWLRIQRRLNQAMDEVNDKGFCSSLGEWDQDLGIVAVPLLIEGYAPLVLACVGPTSKMTRPRVDRELGRRLLAMAAVIQREGASE